MQHPRAVCFDLDDTLAKSLEAPTPEMIERLKKLLGCMPLAVITGRNFARVEPNFLPFLTSSPDNGRFFLIVEGGAACLQWKSGAWEKLYSTSIVPDELERIQKVAEDCLKATRAYDDVPLYGTRFITKEAMLTVMGVGIDAPLELIYTWDPGNVRRKKMWEALMKALPEYDVAMGGATSIDIVKKGINKAYAVRWLSEHIQIPPEDMLYIGDALYPGGNDFAVIPTGIQTRSTSGPEETTRIIDELLAMCS